MDLKKLWEQLRKFWGEQTQTRRILLSIGLVAVLAGSAFIAFFEPTVEYKTVASGLTDRAAGAVVEALEADKTKYRIKSANGLTEIQVPVAIADSVKIKIAGDGITGGGSGGFDAYRDSPSGISSVKEQTLLTIALARELSVVIQGVDAVAMARVVLTDPKRSLYRKEESAPKAAVFVRLLPGRTLSSAEIRGIVNLVANGVDRLTPEGVTLVDRKGKELWSGGAATHVNSIQGEKEREIKEKIGDLLDSTVGPGEYLVRVTATYETSQQVEESEVFESGENSKVSESTTEKMQGAVVFRGVSGVQGNLPGAANPATPGVEPANPGAPESTAGPKPKFSTRTTNWKPARRFTKIIKTEPRLVRIDVGVVINELGPVVTQTSSVSTASGAIALAGSEVVLGPVRVAPDVGKLAGLIRAVAGLEVAQGKDTLRVETYPMWRPQPVAIEKVAPIPPSWYQQLPIWAYGAVAGAGFLAVLGLLFSLRRRKHTIAEEEADLVAFPARADEVEAALEGTEYEPEPTLAELRTGVHELLSQNGELAAEILSAWINEGFEDEEDEEEDDEIAEAA
jgi:flagellar M-ring protein FliF